ncbi:hypothetical protein RF11_04933 [Thelohanellus kitauei]|uniref:Uncharacterized protein n=1 Tax=Thelohanellus kitauei TaxID=669202 RepID=A0A0C2IYG9_THEKT|nr:hypothetical protein RF11_04933 [Thelohanellus kitauei]
MSLEKPRKNNENKNYISLSIKEKKQIKDETEIQYMEFDNNNTIYSLPIDFVEAIQTDHEYTYSEYKIEIPTNILITDRKSTNISMVLNVNTNNMTYTFRVYVLIQYPCSSKNEYSKYMNEQAAVKSILNSNSSISKKVSDIPRYDTGWWSQSKSITAYCRIMQNIKKAMAE